jgi:hypothetical protein
MPAVGSAVVPARLDVPALPLVSSFRSTQAMTERMNGPYNFEWINPNDVSIGRPGHYRVYDADNDRVATCYEYGHACLVKAALNVTWNLSRKVEEKA